jgi:hypothetical protein
MSPILTQDMPLISKFSSRHWNSELLIPLWKIKAMNAVPRFWIQFVKACLTCDEPECLGKMSLNLPHNATLFPVPVNFSCFFDPPNWTFSLVNQSLLLIDFHPEKAFWISMCFPRLWLRFSEFTDQTKQWRHAKRTALHSAMFVLFLRPVFYLPSSFYEISPVLFLVMSRSNRTSSPTTWS